MTSHLPDLNYFDFFDLILIVFCIKDPKINENNDRKKSEMNEMQSATKGGVDVIDQTD